MEKLLRCRDFGTNCDFEVCGETAEQVLNTAVDHARAIHGLKDISDKDRMRARAAVQDAFCVPKGGYNPGGGSLYWFLAPFSQAEREIFCSFSEK